MEGGNGMPGGLLQRSASPGMLHLEMPGNPQQQAYTHCNPHSQQQQQQTQQPFAPLPQPQAYAAYSYGGSGGRGKQQQTHSSEEELGFGDESGAANAATRVSQPQSTSPWHRMKWTDGMVRLLVWVVHSVGDEGSGPGGDGGEQQQKGKKWQAPISPTAAATGLQQKKGKWKSVSQAMMEKGFYVSPQQCEDKFNDLNKRYKRVNEILGKGKACQVVENPALLDSMDHLPYNAKEEARKLLSSKHLFFREMCAYHNSPSAAGGAGCWGGGMAATSSASCEQLLLDHSPSRSSIKGRKGGGSGVGLGTVEEESRYDHCQEEGNDGEEEEEDNYIDEDDSDDEEHDEEEEDEDEKGMLAETGGCGIGSKRKAATSPLVSSPLSLSLSSPSGSTSAPMQQLRNEMMGLQGEQQQRQWLRMRTAELEEQQLVYRQRALHLERQRFKWLRFSNNKEREMERSRLQNQRLCIENERMLLLLQQKEIRLLETVAKPGLTGSMKEQFIRLVNCKKKYS